MATTTEEVQRLVEGVRGGDRAALGRALTLVESSAAKHADIAAELARLLLPGAGGAIRVGISGVPGVGKSTFIEALGLELVGRGHRVAVLAVDPSSSLTGGSILGDKARMNELAMHPSAFVRPSPTAATLGGVARRTRDCMQVVEAAGYDVLLIETVGVGQSETAVADMVDTFCVLMLPGAGDELQGIKKGIIELADVLVIHKADGDNLPAARAAKADLDAALAYLRPKRSSWHPRTVLASSVERQGVDEVWQAILDHRQVLERTGELERTRAAQRVRWLREQLIEELEAAFRAHPGVEQRLSEVEQRVAAGELPVGQAARELLEVFRGRG